MGRVSPWAFFQNKTISSIIEQKCDSVCGICQRLNGPECQEMYTLDECLPSSSNFMTPSPTPLFSPPHEWAWHDTGSMPSPKIVGSNRISKFNLLKQDHAYFEKHSLHTFSVIAHTIMLI